MTLGHFCGYCVDVNLNGCRSGMAITKKKGKRSCWIKLSYCKNCRSQASPCGGILAMICLVLCQPLSHRKIIIIPSSSAFAFSSPIELNIYIYIYNLWSCDWLACNCMRSFRLGFPMFPGIQLQWHFFIIIIFLKVKVHIPSNYYPIDNLFKTFNLDKVFPKLLKIVICNEPSTTKIP